MNNLDTTSIGLSQKAEIILNEVLKTVPGATAREFFGRRTPRVEQMRKEFATQARKLFGETNDRDFIRAAQHAVGMSERAGSVEATKPVSGIPDTK
jgi:hypothetical protein